MTQRKKYTFYGELLLHKPDTTLTFTWLHPVYISKKKKKNIFCAVWLPERQTVRVCGDFVLYSFFVFFSVEKTLQIDLRFPGLCVKAVEMIPNDEFQSEGLVCAFVNE